MEIRNADASVFRCFAHPTIRLGKKPNDLLIVTILKIATWTERYSIKEVVFNKNAKLMWNQLLFHINFCIKHPLSQLCRLIKIMQNYFIPLVYTYSWWNRIGSCNSRFRVPFNSSHTRTVAFIGRLQASSCTKRIGMALIISGGNGGFSIEKKTWW